MSRDFIGRKFENCFKKSVKTYQSLQSIEIIELEKIFLESKNRRAHGTRLIRKFCEIRNGILGNSIQNATAKIKF